MPASGSFGLLKAAVFFTVLFIIFSAVCCHGIDSAELDFTRNEPAKADVVGKWVSATGRLGQGASGTPEREIDLREDGSFSVVDFPTSPNVPGASAKGLLTGSGVWHLDKDLDGYTVWIINLDFANHHRETVHLRRQKPPYLIHIFIGDPDSGQAALFARVL